MINKISKYSCLTFAVLFASGVTANIFVRGEHKYNDNNKNIKHMPSISESRIVEKILNDNKRKKEKPLIVDWTTRQSVIKSGDSIYKLLSNNDISDYDISEVSSVIKKHNESAVNLNIGDRVVFNYKNTNLFSLDIFQDNIFFTKVVLKSKENSEVLVYSDEIPNTVEKKVISGTISSSLYADGVRAGLNNNLVGQLAKVFAWDIDFSRDISEGDKFSVVFEEIISRGKVIETRNLLGAKFVTRKNTYYAFRYIDNGKVGFFGIDGKNLEKAFIRNPVKFPRVTSKFTLKRYHPVLKINRPHRGVDFGGKLNTPIMSTGSGKIIHRGKKGAYGNTVIIDHGLGYHTLYAHLNKFNKKQKRKANVKQGEIIGYMGRTGLVTGVHLHYELRINGKHKDSMNLDLPDGSPVKNVDIFNIYRDELIEMMEK